MTTLGYLYYFRFNNYYNKMLKIKNTLAEYMITQNGSYVYYIGSSTNKVNFNPADQINTQQVIQDENIINADYLMLIGDNDEILSRWFITEVTRNCKGQWVATLKRDVLADNWSDVKYSPMFVERAILPSNSPYIFNAEDISCNQIKTEETLIKDETKCGWICGYMSRSVAEDATKTLNFFGDHWTNYSVYTLQDYLDTYLPGLSFNTVYKDNGWLLQAKLRCSGTDYTDRKWLLIYEDEEGGETYNRYVFTDRTEAGEASILGIQFNTQTLYSGKTWAQWSTYLNQNHPIAFSTLKQYYNLYITDPSSYNTTNFNKIVAETGKYVHTINDDKDYQLVVTRTTTSASYSVTSDLASGYLVSYISNALTAISGITLQAAQRTQYITLIKQANSASLTTNANFSGNHTLIIPKKVDRYNLLDAPYDMFCIPYGKCKVVIGSDEVIMKPDYELSIMQGIASQLKNNKTEESAVELYDMQLLPYCPLTAIAGDAITMITDPDDATKQIPQFTIPAQFTKAYTFIRDTDASVKDGVIFWSSTSSGTKNIELTKSISNYKLDTITKKYRLCSPNMSGVYEFDAAKNYGINGINVDYTYLPYQPYIHLTFNHSSGSLYGYKADGGANDWNDATGLICGGQFSISYLSDAWVNYTVNNKNYKNSFDRQIEYMDKNHHFDMVENGIKAITGSVSAGIQGAAITRNPWAGVGLGIASMAGGIADQFIEQGKYKEEKSYATDNFKYQLDNVQALPNAISSVTSYTENNKVFPYLEIYDCTDAEKTAIANKIAYNSMSLGVIGTINDYLSNSWSYGNITDKGFIKGQLIRFVGADDSHLANEIAMRLAEGVYTK